VEARPAASIVRRRAIDVWTASLDAEARNPTARGDNFHCLINGLRKTNA
jgi:hypothetical protein